MEQHADLQQYVERACGLGAVEARAIDTSTIATAAWVRLKCQYGCGAFNSTLCYPPHTPTPEETQRIIDCYDRAILVHCKPGVNVKKLIVALEREIFLDGFHQAFGFGCGPCTLCSECDRDDCAHPYEARPAMEACGIDVFATARANGFPLDVVTDHSCDQNYYGVVLVD
jgi:predicted metal-binding protein